MRRRSHLHLLAASVATVLASLAALPAMAQAPAWPGKPVRIVVPAPAGSSLDIVARQLSERLKDRWGQPVVVDNKPGAGGMLGTDQVAKAAPDGLTIALSFNGPIAFAPYLYKKVPYDANRDLVPVVMTTSQPNVLAVNAVLPIKSVAELVAWARNKPEGLNYSSLGNGSSAHLTMALFLSEAGLSGTHIPFNGSPPAALAVAQGDVDATFIVAPALMAHVRNNRVRLLAVSSAQHPGSLKDLPSMASAGYKAVESLAWNGLFVPTGTPDAVIQKINTDVNAVLADPAVRAAFDGQGLTPVGGTAAEFRQVVASDSKRWGEVIRKVGISLD
ncbi:Bug family tripartite tricarboxylate transporter substrate binding protein [Ideonella margarita]|uniref:Tripartite tricarboxylate transporter substrate binding protein n=1 Tax=Ideonella margarita TaxID=2984191 RepID=A0ABU9C881_9BURK